MDPQQFDRVRVIVTAAQNILEAAERDREAVNQLLQKLQRLESKVDQSLAQIPRTIEGSLNKLASATAQGAAVKLSEKFVHANQAASDATQLFQAAGNTVWHKYWIATALSQVVFAMALAAAAYYFIPSKAEIVSRQDQLAELNRSITALKNGKR
jgi:ABC-type transporter Mla subunit MlaD